jgi:hypothetical protein
MRDVYLSSPENRVPVNMPLNAQQEMDDCFENSFGVRFRQQSLFCTGSFEVAKSYAGDFGEVRVIRPESRFCFCWGVHSDDLYFEYCKMKDFERIPDFIERLIFKTDDLHHAIQSGNEIMLSGSRFRASKA